MTRGANESFSAITPPVVGNVLDMWI
jgi:hypothetical protein